MVQDWETEAIENIKNRKESCIAYIENEMKKSMKEFVSMSGRWDMEGLKVRMSEILPPMPAAVMAD